PKAQHAQLKCQNYGLPNLPKVEYGRLEYLDYNHYLKSHKISAHADFVPFGELFAYQGFAKKIYDGSQAKSPTFHGSLASK
ncbi:hypothetical protein RFW90_08260, partial [Acinetobacter baumannii]|nr:hypothetical protein [Acinetobacter baumannii]